ncbi:hypothetical protein HY380_01125 [Candidatus Saccharibacteria bacterium]|nr:hypothetical protein [Candidatus Saccharibacteria bacterium]
MRDFIEDLGFWGFVAALVTLTAMVLAAWIYIVGAAFAGWGWPFNFGIDPNRQVTAVTYMADAGFQPKRAYRIVGLESTNSSADTPQCVYKGRDLFSSGVTDNQSGPSWKITINAGGQWAGSRWVTVIIPKSRVPISITGTKQGRVQFVHERLPLYYDHTWDSLYDQHAGGSKGAVVECMDGLSLGRMMNIGLKEVRWLTRQP